MADDESEFEILSDGGPPDEHDLEILETLEEHGADLAEPREIRVNLSFPSEREAEAAGSELEEAGYEVVGFEATARRSRGRSAPPATCAWTATTSPASAATSTISPSATAASSDGWEASED